MMAISVAPLIAHHRSRLLLISNSVFFNGCQKKAPSLIAMYGLKSQVNVLPGIFENNDQTYSVENSRPFIPVQESHHDSHHDHAKHNPDVYHFEVNGPEDVCFSLLIIGPSI